MRGLLILANDYEDAEALVPRDLLIRAKQRVFTLALNTDLVKSKTGLLVKPDMYFKEQKNFLDYDFLLIPGGPWVFNFVNNKDDKYAFLINLIKEYHKQNKFIFAICAAPLILDHAGVLPNNYTCYPGVEAFIKAKDNRLNKPVIIEDKIITAWGPGAAFDFALEIIKTLTNEKETNQLIKELQYLK